MNDFVKKIMPEMNKQLHKRPDPGKACARIIAIRICGEEIPVPDDFHVELDNEELKGAELSIAWQIKSTEEDYRFRCYADIVTIVMM